MLFHESISLRLTSEFGKHSPKKNKKTQQLVDKKATFQRVADSHSTLTL
jgi:hypothetical protein